MSSTPAAAAAAAAIVIGRKELELVSLHTFHMHMQFTPWNPRLNLSYPSAFILSIFNRTR
jgi:hypothetical protein